jgi:hypothetical protein
MSDRKGCIQVSMKIFASVFALIFVLTLPLAVFALSASRVIFSPEVMARIISSRMASSGFMERVIVDDVFNSLIPSQGTDEAGVTRAFAYLSPSDRGEIASLIFPAGWIEAQVNSSVNSIYTWLDDEQPAPVIQIDMMPVKENLLSGGVEDLIEITVDSWPACSIEQVDSLARLLLGDANEVEFCEPGEPLRSGVVEFASILLYDLVESSPDTLLVGEGEDSMGAEAREAKAQIQSLRALMRWGWFLPFSMFGLITILAVRSLRDLSRWWGYPLLLGGISTIMFTFILGVSWSGIVTKWLAGLPSGSALLAQGVKDALEDVAGSVLGRMLIRGGFASLTGVGLLLLPRLRRTGPDTDAARVSFAPEGEEEEVGGGDPISPPPVPPFEDGDEKPGEPPTGIFG